MLLYKKLLLMTFGTTLVEYLGLQGATYHTLEKNVHYWSS